MWTQWCDSWRRFIRWSSPHGLPIGGSHGAPWQPSRYWVLRPCIGDRSRYLAGEAIHTQYTVYTIVYNNTQTDTHTNTLFRYKINRPYKCTAQTLDISRSISDGLISSRGQWRSFDIQAAQPTTLNSLMFAARIHLPS